MTRMRKFAGLSRPAPPTIRYFSSLTSVTTRRLKPWGVVILLLLTSGCAHPASRALQGRWNGESVENFDKEQIAPATGWARGTSFDFDGDHIKVVVPSEESRTGVYRLVAIDNRNVTLSVLDSRGQDSELELIVDDSESLRWVLDEGRTLVMRKQH